MKRIGSTLVVMVFLLTAAVHQVQGSTVNEGQTIFLPIVMGPQRTGARDKASVLAMIANASGIIIGQHAGSGSFWPDGYNT